MMYVHSFKMYLLFSSFFDDLIIPLRLISITQYD